MAINLWLDATSPTMKQLYITGRSQSDRTAVPNGDKIDVCDLGDGVNRLCLIQERELLVVDETTGEETVTPVTYKHEIAAVTVEIALRQTVRVDSRGLVPMFACGMLSYGTYSNGSSEPDPDLPPVVEEPEDPDDPRDPRGKNNSSEA